MLIDWFTVGAQALNFIVLVWLMKRFLYQPILNAIDAREKKIADELAYAAALSDEAKQAKADYVEKNQTFDVQRDALMKKASTEADAESQRLLAQAEQAAADLADKHEASLQAKMQQLNQSLRDSVQKEVFAIAEKALADLADADVETQMVAVFSRRLENMDSSQSAELQRALLANTPAAKANDKLALKVLCSHVLSAAQQQTLRENLGVFLAQDIDVDFLQSQDLICGIEIEVEGFKIGWSMAEYLQSLQERLSDQLENPRL
jgi:F-type H+-transporting ATPase subunit b